MAKRPTQKTPAATRTTKTRPAAARAAEPAAAAAVEPASLDAIAVGDVVDGWTVLAINNPTDVVVAQGAERRSMTLADLVRAKQQAGPQR